VQAVADPWGQTHDKLCNHYGIVAENSVKSVQLDGYFGIQILPKSISTGAPPRTLPLRELTTIPRLPIVSWGRGYPLSIPYPLEAFGTEKRTLEVVPINPVSRSAPACK